MDGGENIDITPLQLRSLERQLMELHHELHMKRRLLAETRKEVEEAVLKQHQLEHVLDQEKQDSETMRLQLQVALSAVQQCSESKNGSQAELSRLRVEKEICIRERDILKQKCHTFKLENVLLNRRMEELQAQLHCQQLYQDRCFEQEMKVTAVMDKLKTDIQALEQDKKRLERSFSVSEGVIGKLKISHNQSIQLLQKLTERQKKYEALIVELRAQVSSLELKKKTNQIIGDNERKPIEDKTNQYLLDLKEFLVEELKGNNKVTSALQKSLEAQSVLEKQEKDAREKLQIQLVEVLKFKDLNAALKRELEETQDSNRKLEEDMKKLQLRPFDDEKGKVDCREGATQTGEETLSDVTSSSPENDNPSNVDSGQNRAIPEDV